MQPLVQRVSEWLSTHVPNVLRIALILLVAFALAKIARLAIRRIERLIEDDEPDVHSDREKRARTLGRVMRQALTIGIWTLAIVTILGEMGVAIGPIIAGAGIAGIAVGFGAQTLVRDMIAGFFVLLENQYRVGDVVSVSGVTGTVEAINIRTTVLRDSDGSVHVVPNGTIGVVTNRTRGWSRAMLDVAVAYREDTDRAFEVLRRVGSAMEKDPVFGAKLLEPFEYPGVERIDDAAVVLRMMVRTRPHEHWTVVRELRRRIKHELAEAGIETPYPQRTLLVHPEEGAVRAQAPREE